MKINKRDWKTESIINNNLYKLNIGDKVNINSNLKGKIIDIITGHGRFFIIELPQKDYNQERIIYLDVEELEDYKKVFINENK